PRSRIGLRSMPADASARPHRDGPRDRRGRDLPCTFVVVVCYWCRLDCRRWAFNADRGFTEHELTNIYAVTRPHLRGRDMSTSATHDQESPHKAVYDPPPGLDRSISEVPLIQAS